MSQIDDSVSSEAQGALDFLAEMGQEFSSTPDLDKTLLKAVHLIAEYVKAEAGALFLLDKNQKYLDCVASVGPVQITGLRLNADHGIVGNSVQQNSGYIVKDVEADPTFNKAVDDKTGYKTRSILCAPMGVKDERVGAIELINKRGDTGLFSDDDLNLLQVLATSAALAILNARMAEQLVEQERLRRELELAAEIQRSLLPNISPEDFPVHGMNLPARVVSGDFYDYYQLDDGRIAFTLGDVSGKGMNAALLMAKTASLLRCLGKAILEPGALLARVNEEVCETVTRGMFVTLVQGIYDPERGYVRFANAGHEPPLVLTSKGEFFTIPAESPPLGISPSLIGDENFPEQEIHLDGGALYIFSDGVTEGYLAMGDELGAEGFKSLVKKTEKKGVFSLLSILKAKILEGDRPLRDDVTLLVVDDNISVKSKRFERGFVEAGPTVSLGEKLMTIRIAARPDRLRLVRRSVEETSKFIGFGKNDVSDIVLAVDEACQNIIRHAYKANEDGEISIEIRKRDSAMIILLRDYAEAIDVSKVKPRDLNDIKPGGLGTHLIREVMDDVNFLSPPFDGGNLLRMVKMIG
ncbi:MAG: Phosphoserine phosphatase RsbU [Alphaproteobacteria bacterium MarineAlpha3_Bin5]|nr:serine/threonine protein phosphatase [Magnetovibrio sp.]PPR78183.1 MAG: Phosphoserine phosphatase RsbU [Alphaproteobacteria bacterium MarineAlpha3_Bin5]